MRVDADTIKDPIKVFVALNLIGLRITNYTTHSQMVELPHFDHDGHARMVDVGEKPITRRVATASGRVTMKPETLALILDGGIQKGNVLELARVAAVMATKRTADIVPLCHPLRLDSVSVKFTVPDETTVDIVATVSANERTGVEMEALMAVSAAGLTIYDMCKSVDRGMQISNIRLDEKSGGKSGHFQRSNGSNE